MAARRTAAIGAGGIGVLALCGLSSAPAWAQADPEGVDLHGEMAPVPTGNASSPVTTLGAPLGVAGAWSVSALGEFANDPARVYERTAPGAEITSRPLVDGFAMVHLGGGYAPSRRLHLVGAMPLYFTAANYTSEMPTVGDLYLRGHIGLLLPDEADLTGPALGLVPMVALPTGNGRRLVGNELWAGASLTAGHRWAWGAVDGHAGVRVRETVTLPSQTIGGTQLPWGLAVGFRVVDPVWAHLELRGMADPGSLPSLEGGDAVDLGSVGSTVEGMLALSSRFGPVYTAGSLGTATSPGIGAARSRGFLGVAYTVLPLPEPMPLVVPRVVFDVRDPTGAPVQGAVVRADGVEVGRTGADGRVELAADALWPATVTVVGTSLEEAAVAAPPPPAETDDGVAPVSDVRVELAWKPAVLDARVTDVEGQTVQATLVARPAGGGEVRTGAPGELLLTPGTWEVTVSAEGLASQRRAVVVAADGRPPESFEAVLAAPAGDEQLVLAVVDADNQPVPGARVLVDGLQVGTVAGGALVALEGLDGDDVQLEVQHPAYTTLITEGTPGTPKTLVLARVPGSVKVVAVGPEGEPVPDALVRFLGPSRLAPAELGPRGERVQVLGVGTWDVLVSSPSYGLQRRVIEVEPDQYAMLVVEVQLQRDEGGDAALRVSVVDASATPVAGAEVLLGGAPYGETSTGGLVEVEGLAAGARDLEVRGELLRPLPPRSVDLLRGRNDEVVPVRWVEGAVEVSVVGPEGPVDDALVRLMGPEVRVLPLGSDGVERTVVPPGEWTVLASSPTLGLQQRALTVLPDSDVLHRVEVVLTPPEGGLAELSLRVVDPDGQPAAGAVVALDDVPLGATGPAGDLTLQQLAVGDRTLAISGLLYEPSTTEVQLMEGPQTVEAELQWAPGVVRVSVVDGEGPIDDAVVRVLGPLSVQPAAVDARGQRTVRLAPGSWQLLVSSPRYGVAEAALVVPEGLSDLLEVEVRMSPTAGASVLALAVVDPDGKPVVGAEVLSGKRVVGRTGEGGLLVVDGLGDRTALTVRHPGHTDYVDELRLQGSVLERTIELPWRPRSVGVTVTGPDGAPLTGASVQLVGPEDIEPVVSDAAGVASFEVRPGTWAVIAQRGDLGPARAEVVVPTTGAVSSVSLQLGEGELEVGDRTIALRRQVLFGFDSATLSPEADPVLDQVASALLSGGALRVEVQGHSDTVGDLAYNQALSSARAQAVRDALVARGVPAETLVARGYGPQRPVGDNRTEAGRAANRRVAFVIVERGAER